MSTGTLSTVRRSIANRISARRGIGSYVSLLSYRLSGSPLPPPHAIKMYWLDRMRRRYNVRTLIETGTYQGATVEAFLDTLDRIVTVELDPELWRAAHVRFSSSPRVQVVLGNSADALSEVLNQTKERCLFWLDGHYSGPGTARGMTDSPIRKELEAIRSHSRHDHIILVDDARLFTGADGYLTLEEMRTVLREINAGYKVRVIDDIIQACP